MKHVDYIIVGQGLAGSILAFSLLEKGKKVMVLQSPNRKASSDVAAGMFNPITGKRTVKTWLADQLFPFLIERYHYFESLFKGKYLHDVGIFHPFLTIEEQNEWISKEPELRFIEQFDFSFSHPFFNAPLGGAHIYSSGYVDILPLLRDFEAYFKSKESIMQKQVKIENVLLQNDKIEIDEISTNAIIFCEGVAAKTDSFFHYLPFTPVKGEILRVKMEATYNKLINRGVFMIPKPENEFVVGATYDWNDLTTNPSESGKSELLCKMEKIYSGKYQIIDQWAGIRPATKDRRPFLGKHPTYPNVFIFNGFGSKGVSLIPYLAQHFSDVLLGKAELIKEINIDRFLTLYQNP